MSLDDLLKGLSAFNQGVTQYATTKAVNDANEQLQALNTQEMDKNARFQAQAQIGQGLAMQLGAVGANPALIQEMSSQAGPSMGAQYAAEQNKQLQESSQQAQKNLAEQRFGYDKQIEEMKLDLEEKKATAKRQKDFAAHIRPYQKQFASDAKDLESFYTSAKTAAELVTQNAPGSKAVAQMQLATAISGKQMTDAEREVFQGSAALKDRFLRSLKNYQSGTASKADIEFTRNVANKLAQAAQNQLSTKAQRYAGQAFEALSSAGYDYTPEEIMQKINPKNLNFGGKPAPEQAAPVQPGILAPDKEAVLKQALQDPNTPAEKKLLIKKTLDKYNVKY